MIAVCQAGTAAARPQARDLPRERALTFPWLRDDVLVLAGPEEVAGLRYELVVGELCALPFRDPDVCGGGERGRRSIAWDGGARLLISLSLSPARRQGGRGAQQVDVDQRVVVRAARPFIRKNGVHLRRRKFTRLRMLHPPHPNHPPTHPCHPSRGFALAPAPQPSSSLPRCRCARRSSSVRCGRRGTCPHRQAARTRPARLPRRRMTTWPWPPAGLSLAPLGAGLRCRAGLRCTAGQNLLPSAKAGKSKDHAWHRHVVLGKDHTETFQRPAQNAYMYAKIRVTAVLCFDETKLVLKYFVFNKGSARNDISFRPTFRTTKI